MRHRNRIGILIRVVSVLMLVGILSLAVPLGVSADGVGNTLIAEPLGGEHGMGWVIEVDSSGTIVWQKSVLGGGGPYDAERLPPPRAVPGITGWGVMAAVVAMGGFAVLMMRRRKAYQTR